MERRAPLGTEARRVGAEIGGLLVAAAAFIAFYWYAGFPIYNNATWLDPWYYTGLFVNFHFLHSTFSTAYYVTRLPWLIPGRAIFAIFSPTPAYLVLHLVTGVAAVAAIYLLVRRYLGRLPAFASAAAVASSPLAYHALYRDYVNAGELTYFYIGMFFGLGARAGRRPRVAMAGAGFFLTAAFATHFLSAMFTAGLVVPYFLLFRPNRPSLIRDAVAFVVGSVALLFGCAVYSVAVGGRFDFLHAALGATGQLNLAGYKRHGVSWVLAEPWILVPVFVVVVLVVLLVRGRADTTSSARAFAWAIGAYTVVMSVAVVVWEVFLGGVLFEWVDYFELFFSIAVLPAIGIAAGLLIRWGQKRSLRGTGAVATVGLVAGFVVPVLAIFRFGWTWRVYRPAFVPSVILLALTVLAVAASAFVGRQKLYRSVAAVICSTAFGLSVAYPVAASMDVDSNVNLARSNNRIDTGTFKVGIAWVRWMESQGLQDTHMDTWYDQRTSPNFPGLASFYFYGFVLLDANMPNVTPEFRAMWKKRDPKEVVLLCKSADCEGAEGALVRAGYAVHLRAARLFTSGPVHLWVRVLAVGAA